MKSLLILLSGVLLIGLEECRLYEEVFVPVLITQPRVRRQAPAVNVHKIPKTSFTCDGKKSGEYYADTETKCQVYHVCVPGFNGKMSSMSFVCPNGTIFNQASRVCSPFDRVDCSLARRYYESLHGDPNQHRTDYDGPTGPTVPVHRPVHHASAPSRPRQSPARPHSVPPPPPPPPPPRQSSRPTAPASRSRSRATSPPSTAAPVRTARPNVPRVPPNVPRTSFRSGVSTSTSAYEYDYEYDYEDEPEDKRSKRDVDPLKFFLFDSSRIPIQTKFTCDDKVSGSIYADMETNCEMFHLCIPVSKKKLLDYKLFCNEGKAFDQETGYCRDMGTFDCSKSQMFYKYDKINSYFAGKKIISKNVNKIKSVPTEK